MRLKKSIAVVALVLTIAGIVSARNERSIRVAYHRYQMQRNYDATFAAEEDLGGGFRGFTLGASFSAFEYHRDALVALGEVDEKRYFLQHLVPGTEEKRHFWRALCLNECPKNIFVVGERDEVGEPWPMTVWCWPCDTTAWDEYIAARDTENYASKFMASETISDQQDTNQAVPPSRR